MSDEISKQQEDVVMIVTATLCHDPACMYTDVCESCVDKGFEVHRILDKDGLLAPDLPQPLTAANGNPVWRADGTLMVTRYPDGEIAMLLNPKQEARYTPQAARDQAALLLAAANYSEGNQK